MSFEIDKRHDIPVYSPFCALCKHLNRQIFDIPGNCKAFKIIPMKIWEGKIGHIKKYSGQDNDIVFEKIKKEN